MTQIQNVSCPICSQCMSSDDINQHLDRDCQWLPVSPSTSQKLGSVKSADNLSGNLNHFIRPRTDDSVQQSPTFSSMNNAEQNNSEININKKIKRMHSKPLAELIRPNNLQEFMGHETLVGNGSMLQALVQDKKLPNMILWGPPGCGKTTLARIMGIIIVVI